MPVPKKMQSSRTRCTYYKVCAGFIHAKKKIHNEAIAVQGSLTIYMNSFEVGFFLRPFICPCSTALLGAGEWFLLGLRGLLGKER